MAERVDAQTDLSRPDPYNNFRFRYQPPDSPDQEAMEKLRREVSLQLTKVDEQIRVHKRSEESESYIGKLLDAVWQKDNRSLSDLEDWSAKRQAIVQELPDKSKKELTDTIVGMSEAIETDRTELGVQQNINSYGGMALKLGFLFYGGKIGYIGTGATFALDQMKPSDAWSTQLLDGSLGVAKGTLLKGTFQMISGLNTNVAFKGVGLGFANRAIDTVLTRETFQDGAGNFDFSSGLSRTASVTFSPRAMIIDGVLMGASYGAVSQINSMTGNVIARSPFASTVASGAIFGFSSGATGEALRQYDSGEKLSVGNILLHGGLSAAVSGLAAVPGGIQADPVVRGRLKTEFRGLIAEFKIDNHQIYSSSLTEKITASRRNDGTYDVNHHRWGEDFRLVKNDAELAQLRQQLGGQAGQKLAEVLTPDQGSLVSTGDRMLVRVEPGDKVVRIKVNESGSQQMTVEQMNNRYDRNYTGAVTRMGKQWELADAIVNGPSGKPLSLAPRGRSGLGSYNYPLRRFPDLTAQQKVDFIFGKARTVGPGTDIATPLPVPDRSSN